MSTDHNFATRKESNGELHGFDFSCSCNVWLSDPHLSLKKVTLYVLQLLSSSLTKEMIPKNKSTMEEAACSTVFLFVVYYYYYDYHAAGGLPGPLAETDERDSEAAGHQHCRRP